MSVFLRSSISLIGNKRNLVCSSTSFLRSLKLKNNNGDGFAKQLLLKNSIGDCHYMSTTTSTSTSTSKTSNTATTKKQQPTKPPVYKFTPKGENNGTNAQQEPNSRLGFFLPSSKARNIREITKKDIFPSKLYDMIRNDAQELRRKVKKNRRMDVGPNATFLFQNYDLVWFQIQEMLAIEKGGESQLEDEIHAYAPLVPNGNELVFAFMLGWADADVRKKKLASLGGIENLITLKFKGENLKAIAKEDGIERTTDSGITSAVHFLYFQLNAQQVYI